MSAERLRDLNDLLGPSLAGGRAARPPYSIRAQVIVAIVGGVFAALGLCAASSLRIGSLRRDVWLYVAAIGHLDDAFVVQIGDYQHGANLFGHSIAVGRPAMTGRAVNVESLLTTLEQRRGDR